MKWSGSLDPWPLFWRSSRMHGESILFIEQAPGLAATSSLQWTGYTPEFSGASAPRTMDRLRRHEALTLCLTGNGLNHPNDFGHRLYAHTILSLLVE